MNNKLKCRVCGHRWQRRKDNGLPLKCPNQLCQSPHWQNGKPKKAA